MTHLNLSGFETLSGAYTVAVFGYGRWGHSPPPNLADVDVDMDEKFHIHGNPGVEVSVTNNIVANTGENCRQCGRDLTAGAESKVVSDYARTFMDINIAP